MAFFDSKCLRFNDICLKRGSVCTVKFYGCTRHFIICRYIYSTAFFFQVWDAPSRVIKFVCLRTPFKIYPPSLSRDISVVGRHVNQVLVLLSDEMIRRFLAKWELERPTFRFESSEVLCILISITFLMCLHECDLKKNDSKHLYFI